MRYLHRTTERPTIGFSLVAYLRGLDWILLAAALGLVGFGMSMIYSATHADANISSPTFYVRSQAEGLAIGFVLLVILSLVNYRRFARWQKYIYGLAVVLLVLTLIIGSERMGARRWIELPFFDLQSSEVAKLLLVISLAAFLAEGVELRSRFRFVILTVLYVTIPAALVFVEPDLGTALVFFVILVVMLVVWGIRWSHAGILTGSVAVLAVVVLRVLPSVFGFHLLKDYQLQRLTAFLAPERDLTGQGYQLMQSKIAVGSGMFTGKGFMRGTQTHLNYLPAHHTDFIFAVIGEELGFLGSMLLLVLYVVIAWRAFRIASRSVDLFGTLIAAGIAAVIIFQVFVNVGMSIGIMPVTGIPLPFVSFGSSSLVVFLMAIGVLESIHSRSVSNPGERRRQQFLNV